MQDRRPKPPGCLTVRSVFLSVPGAMAQGNYGGRGTPLPFVQRPTQLVAGVAHAVAPRGVPAGTLLRGDHSPEVRGMCQAHQGDPVTGIRRRSAVQRTRAHRMPHRASRSRARSPEGKAASGAAEPVTSGRHFAQCARRSGAARGYSVVTVSKLPVKTRGAGCEGRCSASAPSKRCARIQARQPQRPRSAA